MKTVRQLLETKGNRIYSVPPDCLIYDALVILAEHRIGAVLVMRGKEKPSGVAE